MLCAAPITSFTPAISAILLILKKLAEIAPVTAIRGNVDRKAWVAKIPATNVLEVGGISIYMLHNLSELDLKPEGGWICGCGCGHTHKATQEMKNGVLYFNPGSAGPRRFRLPVTVGRITVKDGKVSAEIVEILPEQSSRALLGRADEGICPYVSV